MAVAVLISARCFFKRLSFSQVLNTNGEGRGQLLGDVEIMLIKIFTDENYLENPHNIETIILHYKITFNIHILYFCKIFFVYERNVIPWYFYGEDEREKVFALLIIFCISSSRFLIKLKGFLKWFQHSTGQSEERTGGILGSNQWIVIN